MAPPTALPTAVVAANSNASTVAVAFAPVGDASVTSYVASVIAPISAATIDVAGNLTLPQHTTIAPQSVAVSIQNAYQVATNTLTTQTFTLAVYDNATPVLALAQPVVCCNTYAAGFTTPVVSQVMSNTGPLAWSMATTQPVYGAASMSDGVLTMGQHAFCASNAASAIVQTAFQLATATATVQPFTLLVYDNNTPALAALPSTQLLFSDTFPGGAATTTLLQNAVGTCNVKWTLTDVSNNPISALSIQGSGDNRSATLSVAGRSYTAVNQSVRVMAQTAYQARVGDTSTASTFALTYLSRTPPVQAPTLTAAVSGPSNVVVAVAPIVDDVPAYGGWNASFTCNGYSAVLGYAIALAPGGAVLQQAVPGTPTTTFSVTGLNAGQTYAFYATASNALSSPGNEGAWSLTPATVTAITFPPSMTGQTLVATVAPGAPGNSNLTVAFAALAPPASAPVGAYVVSTTPSPGGAVAQTASSPASVPCMPGVSYAFYVAACNAAGFGGWTFNSVPVTAITVPPAATGLAPVVAVNGVGSFIITCPTLNAWAGQPVASYAVFGQSGLVGFAPLVASNLAVGSLYTYTYAASNLVGVGGLSLPTSITAIGLPVGTAGTPSASVAGPGALNVSFAASVASTTAYPVQFYAVSTSNLASGQPRVGFTATVTGTAVATVPNLSPGTAYAFYVAASNAAGLATTWSLASPPQVAIGLPTCNIAPTTAVFPGSTPSVLVSFTAAGSGGIAYPINGYVVAESSGGATIGTTATVSGPASVVVTPLTAGASYSFYVAGSNAAGIGAYSSTPSTITAITTPGSAASIVANAWVAGDRAIAVSFPASVTSNNAAPVSLYVLSLTSGGSTIGATALTTGTPTLTFTTANGLVLGNTYAFYVAASNAAGAGAWSTVGSNITVITYPPSAAAVTPTATFAGNCAALVSFATVTGTVAAPVKGHVVALTSNGNVCGSNVVTLSGTATALVQSLQPGTYTYFYMAASNVVGTGAWSTASPPFTAITYPSSAAASTVTTSAVGDRVLSVAFTTPAPTTGTPINGYVLSSNVTMNPIMWNGMTSPMTFNSGIVADGLTTYSFYLAASNAVGLGIPSPASSPVYAITYPPSMLSVIPTTNIIGNLTVKVNYDISGLNSFIPPTNNFFIVSNAGIIMSSTLSKNSNIILSGLSAGSNYTFAVAASNLCGIGLWSSSSTNIIAITYPPSLTGITPIVNASLQNITVPITVWAGSPVNAFFINTYINNTFYTSNVIIGSVVPLYLPGSYFTGVAYTFSLATSNMLGMGGWSYQSLPYIPNAPVIDLYVTANPKNFTSTTGVIFDNTNTCVTLPNTSITLSSTANIYYNSSNGVTLLCRSYQNAQLSSSSTPQSFIQIGNTDINIMLDNGIATLTFFGNTYSNYSSNYLQGNYNTFVVCYNKLTSNITFMCNDKIQLYQTISMLPPDKIGITCIAGSSSKYINIQYIKMFPCAMTLNQILSFAVDVNSSTIMPSVNYMWNSVFDVNVSNVAIFNSNINIQNNYISFSSNILNKGIVVGSNVNMNYATQGFTIFGYFNNTVGYTFIPNAGHYPYGTGRGGGGAGGITVLDNNGVIVVNPNNAIGQVRTSYGDGGSGCDINVDLDITPTYPEGGFVYIFNNNTSEQYFMNSSSWYPNYTLETSQLITMTTSGIITMILMGSGCPGIFGNGIGGNGGNAGLLVNYNIYVTAGTVFTIQSVPYWGPIYGVGESYAIVNGIKYTSSFATSTSGSSGGGLPGMQGSSAGYGNYGMGNTQFMNVISYNTINMFDFSVANNNGLNLILNNGNATINWTNVSFNGLSNVTYLNKTDTSFILRYSPTTCNLTYIVNNVKICSTTAYGVSNQVGTLCQIGNNWSQTQLSQFMLIKYFKYFTYAMTDDQINAFSTDVSGQTVNNVLTTTLNALNFDASTIIVGVGNVITTWTNSGAMGTVYSATSYGSPKLGSQNGLNHVIFNGSTYFNIVGSLPLNWFNVSGNYNGFTLVVVAKYTNQPTSSWESFLDFGNGAGIDNIFFSRYFGLQGITFDVYNGSTDITGNSALSVRFTEDYMFHIYIVNVTNASSGSTYTIYRDNINIPSVTVTMSTPINNRTTVNNYIGKSNWNYNNLKAYIREIIMFNTSLSSPQMTSMFQILTAKWSLLPSAPVITQVSAGTGIAIITLTAPISNGSPTILFYTASASGSGGQTGTFTGAIPTTITVNGLVSGNSYTFTVTATNAIGTGTPSIASTPVVPN